MKWQSNFGGCFEKILSLIPTERSHLLSPFEKIFSYIPNFRGVKVNPLCKNPSHLFGMAEGKWKPYCDKIFNSSYLPTARFWRKNEPLFCKKMKNFRKNFSEVGRKRRRSFLSKQTVWIATVNKTPAARCCATS